MRFLAIQVMLGIHMCLMLVVDDDDLMRASVAALLSLSGHDIIEARNGLEAAVIYMAKHEKIHLVIMSAVMPKMDGIAATRAIKKNHPSAKVILMSEGSGLHLPEEADALLIRPFRYKDLCESVEQVLQMA